MKARYEELVIRKGNQSFLAYQFVITRFQFHWHFHPEYELTLITSGSGKRMVGDSHEDFHEFDLVLIGPQVPHTWVSDKLLKSKPSAVVIQFTEDFIESLTHYPECSAIRNLLVRAEKGLRFPVTEHDDIIESIKTLPKKKEAERIIGLLTLLDKLSGYRSMTLSSDAFRPPKSTHNEKRINRICQYIEDDTRAANISKAAGLIHLSESAFCKFFKRQTGKTFSDYVNTIRISDACRQLTQSEKSIADIAHEAGFESLTYFNRVFLKKKGLRPREFRGKQ